MSYLSHYHDKHPAALLNTIQNPLPAFDNSITSVQDSLRSFLQPESFTLVCVCQQIFFAYGDFWIVFLGCPCLVPGQS